VLPKYPLPEKYVGRAADLCEALRLTELRDRKSREFSIFGGSSVLLWVNDAMSRLTDDVDIDGDTPPKDVQVDFQSSPIQNYLISPDWKEARVDATDALGLQHWRVWLVHPVDLITLKLGRWDDRDFQDAALLVKVFEIDAELVLQRLDEAWKYYATANQHNRSKIALGFEDLFSTKLSDDDLKVMSVDDYLI
jgi:hypothetical protein